MSEKRVLVIDDSATIRRLVDRCLTPEGYQVILAATAEEGLQRVGESPPDLILLDHQLPGTTGKEVCQRLLELPGVAEIPIVASSTLRKRAYVEYTEFPNVVDMLPKPYSAELLMTTVQTALDTGTLVVASQSQGTAVPEVIQEAGEADLAGTFNTFSVREVLDFLNNANKCGTLEIEGRGQRLFYHLRDGRIAGVSSSGIDADELVDLLPESLQNLAPVLRLTVGGRAGAELNSIMELLDRKVVDPRLLRKLLRHQAAALAWRCFTEEWKEFRFAATAQVPPLYQKLPLNISLLALLIEGALDCSAPPSDDEADVVYRRSPVRGQNLDRAGVSAQHMQLLKLLSERRSTAELAEQLGWEPATVHRVLQALVFADLVERQSRDASRPIVVWDTDPEASQPLRAALDANNQRYFGKVVRDRFGMQLVLRRMRPAAVVLEVDAEGAVELMRETAATDAMADARWVAILPANADAGQVVRQFASANLPLHGTICRPFQSEELFDVLDAVLHDETRPAAQQQSAVEQFQGAAP